MSPTLDYFLPYQQLWINESAPLAIGEKSRRIGFTHAHAYKAVEDRIKGKCDYWHSSADLSASVEFAQECRMWAAVFNVGCKLVEADEVIDDSTISTLQLRFDSGRKIVCGSSNPKFFRSKGGDAGLDEFAFHAQGRELFKAAHATAMFWGFKLRIWSTHTGEGSYYNGLLKAAREGRLRANVHTVTVTDAVEQGLVEKIKNLKGRDDKARQEWLDELRSTCPDTDTWNEEYMCQPSSDQSSLLSYPLIQSCEVSNLQQVPNAELGEGCYAGFDVGRKNDVSALWVIQRVGDTFWTRQIKVLANTSFSAQEGLLNEIIPRVKRLCIDSTGIGMQMAERLQQKHGKYRVEAVHFTAPVKSELAMPLRRLFEDKLLRIPSDDVVREDLHKIRKIVTAANNIRLDADRDADGHADRFWALALAYHAAEDNKAPLPPPLRRKPVGW